MNATDLRALLARWAGVMADKRDWLIELDSVVGDSDLGLTMSDGFRAAASATLRTWANCAIRRVRPWPPPCPPPWGRSWPAD